MITIQEYLKQIDNSTVYDVAIVSPIVKACRLSKRFCNTFLLKREDLQQVFSFKLRGAYHKISQLSKKQKNAGIITASAGNHAQGVALAGQKLSISATIVMPKTTPLIKIQNVKNLKANVVLHGDTFDEAYKYAKQLEKKKQLTFIHPYDDPKVICGQGTIGKEIIDSCQDVSYVFVPVGGGGLIAGVSLYIKSKNPNIKIIGVEADSSACLKKALKANKRVILPEVGIFADGVAVAQIGKETFRLAKQFVDEVITCSTDEICAAIKDFFDDTRSIAEPAGALAIAGAKKFIEERKIKNKKLIAIATGANVNFDRLRHISERAEIGEKAEAIFAVTIPEEKGRFLDFCKTLDGYNISEFNYRYSSPKEANLFVGIKINSPDDRNKIITLLNKHKFSAIDLTDDEISKIHIRHMVGGRNADIKNENIYSFEFPERPKALLDFLTSLGLRWNISMFHYRNHGAAFGRVLMGIQFKEKEKQEVEFALDKLNYKYTQHNKNPACQLFLK